MNKESENSIEKELIKYMESIFMNSSSSDELFDTLELGLKNGICRPELYKVLLANPALSSDELIMFTEKIVEENSKCVYDMYMWTAKLFESRSFDYNNIETSLYYYQKALISSPTKYEPILAALLLYSYDFEYHWNSTILKIANNGLNNVENKGKVFEAMAQHYKKSGEKQLSRKFAKLAADFFSSNS